MRPDKLLADLINIFHPNSLDEKNILWFKELKEEVKK